MNQLEENRLIINEVDQQLTELFVKRFNAVKGILSYKIEHGLPVLDRSREAELLNSREQEVPEELRPYFRAFYEALIASSRQFQTDHLNEETAE
ncbi:MAG: chorismate mutase [Solobacterium sp.]|nr:chorismate mutase [Solobacterium sp.]